jgi:hypothetical protein
MHTQALPRSVAKRSTQATALALASCVVLLCTLTADAANAAGKVRSVTCRGGSSSCSATVGLAGGASNVKLKIALSDTDLKLKGVTVKPSSVRGAYELSKGAYSLGGSLYTVTLNAVQSIPKGATLTLKFAEPARSGGGPRSGGGK